MRCARCATFCIAARKCRHGVDHTAHPRKPVSPRTRTRAAAQRERQNARQNDQLVLDSTINNIQENLEDSEMNGRQSMFRSTLMAKKRRVVLLLTPHKHSRVQEALTASPTGVASRAWLAGDIASVPTVVAARIGWAC